MAESKFFNWSSRIRSARIALGYWLLRKALDAFPPDSLEEEAMILWIRRELQP